jgi:hypothetical protein
MFHPGAYNLCFVLAASNSPVLWSGLSVTDPNGRDILGEMEVINMSKFPLDATELDVTISELARVLQLQPHETKKFLLGTWNASPGMYAYLGECYLRHKDFPIDQAARKSITYASEQSQQQVHRDYYYMFSLPHNHQDARSCLWKALLGVFSVCGGDDLTMQQATRRIMISFCYYYYF